MATHDSAGHDVSITVESGKIEVQGTLTVPANARGLVIFAHGSGSGRFSPRNRYVVGVLNKSAFGTLLFDLLTKSEEAEDLVTAALRFDIDLLSRRLGSVTDWICAQSDFANLPIGFFGASTGAAAALKASVGRERVSAIVSRGGRPDMAGNALKKVTAKTLLIVGGNDSAVLDLNRAALAALGADTKELQIVPGATHLFEEPGALEKASELARNWFDRYSGRTPL